MIQQSGPVSFTQTGSQIDVNPIANTLNGSATLTAVSNPVAKGVTGTNTQNITGTANFTYDEGMGAVTLTNDSTEELVVSSISVLNPSQLVNVSLSPASSSFTYTTSLSNTGGTFVTITNNSNADILLTGTIDNSEGITTVTNTGGNILSSGRGQLIESQLVALTSMSASIGTANDPINIELIESSCWLGVPTFKPLRAINDDYSTCRAL